MSTLLKLVHTASHMRHDKTVDRRRDAVQADSYA